jgi:hypothetical protein
VRVAPGSYVPRGSWVALSRMDRHLVRVQEAADRARHPILFSHHAAAAIWGIDLIGDWPVLIDALVFDRGGGRSTGIFRRRTMRRRDVPTVMWRGHEVTSPAQTAVDLARSGTFTLGVIALDQALWLRRADGPLACRDDLDAVLERPWPRGGARARTAAAFATELSDSVRESQSRVLIDRLGFPAPVLQQRFRLSRGRVAHTDFWFPVFDHVGEYDGIGKYFDPDLLRGRSSQDALIEEKDRGDELRRQVRALSRWRTPALRDPRLLYDIFTADGLPSTRARPPRGLHLS